MILTLLLTKMLTKRSIIIYLVYTYATDLRPTYILYISYISHIVYIPLMNIHFVCPHVCASVRIVPYVFGLCAKLDLLFEQLKYTLSTI